jgi:glucose/arabinose dehydrogenase
MNASRRIHLAVLGTPLLAASPATAQITATSIVQNLNVGIKLAAPAGDDRLFLAHQTGEISVIENGVVKATPFLDLSGIVHQGQIEQGLLGLAFHPDYAVNGHFYVNYTTGATAKTVIERYTVSSNPDSADENSGLTILEMVRPSNQHNGGNVLFGPDGYLWIGTGDGGQPGNGQNTSTLLGKMVRIDVDGDDFPADSLRNYRIPPDNPFLGDPLVLDEIWAIGIRNPFRYNFDSQTGDLYFGDVGGNAYEEINFEAAGDPGGRNYGWADWEGDSCRVMPCDTTGFTAPIFAYAHNPLALHAVIGGYVYHGSALPSWLQGHYFFADQAWPGLFSFRYENGVVTEYTDWTVTLDVGNALKFPTDFWEDEDGELHIVEWRQNGTGEIWKIVPDSTALGAEPAPAPLSVTLDVPHPNPFTAATRFAVHAPADQPVRVGVYDTAGRLVRPLHLGPLHGAPRVLGWDGRDTQGRTVAAGMYFVRAETQRETVTRKVALLR